MSFLDQILAKKNKRIDVSLKEYEQTVQQVRAYSTQIRWSVTSSSALSFAFIAAISFRFEYYFSTFLIAVLGIFLNVISIFVIERLKHAINSCFDRALEIEKILGMKLFTSIEKKVTTTHLFPSSLKKVSKEKYSNTKLFQIFCGAYAAVFMILAIQILIKMVNYNG